MKTIALLLLVFIGTTGCSKAPFVPPAEHALDGRWYFGNNPVNGTIGWSKIDGEYYRDDNHALVEKRGGRYTRIECMDGLPASWMIRDYRGDGTEPAEDTVKYRGGKKHGPEWIRDLAGNVGYRYWCAMAARWTRKR